MVTTSMVVVDGAVMVGGDGGGGGMWSMELSNYSHEQRRADEQ